MSKSRRLFFVAALLVMALPLLNRVLDHWASGRAAQESYLDTHCRHRVGYICTAICPIYDRLGPACTPMPSDLSSALRQLELTGLLFPCPLVGLKGAGTSVSPGDLVSDEWGVSFDGWDYWVRRVPFRRGCDASDVPIVWDRRGNHPDGSVSVGFLDYHTRSVGDVFELHRLLSKSSP